MSSGELKPRLVTRDELYGLVWQKPMSRLAAEFGVTGNGLAKACDRLDVPYPPRGYWAKKAAGKRVVQFKLPPLKAGAAEATYVAPSPPRPLPPPKTEYPAETAAKLLVADIVVPESLGGLHPRVQAWIAEHNQEQLEQERERKRGGFSLWGPLANLTERDLYRFRVTSAIFEGVEKAGGEISASPITGKITFLVDGNEIECSIVEKLVKVLRTWKDQGEWTAYPRHHNSNLTSSGFLRVSINAYLRNERPEWIETDKIKMAAHLPEIVGALIALGPILTKRQREHEERERHRLEEEQRRYEARLRAELDQKRWDRLCSYAANWEDMAKLRPFLAELEARLEAEGDIEIGDRHLSRWIEWVREHIQALDPFHSGAVGLFTAISKIERWS